MNRIINSFALVALLALLLVSCQAPQTNVAEVRKAIEAGAERWASAFNAKDAATLASFYAADANILPPNGPQVAGHENFETLFKQMFEIGGDLKLTVSHVDASADLAYEVGGYTMGITMPGMPPMTDTGKYVAVWKRQADGKWLIVADTWNTNLPMPTPPPVEPKKK